MDDFVGGCVVLFFVVVSVLGTLVICTGEYLFADEWQCVESVKVDVDDYRCTQYKYVCDPKGASFSEICPMGDK